MSQPWGDAVLMIRHPDGGASSVRLPADGGPVVIGRTAGAHILIDHAMISRRHAELFRDAAGRWHVRDLQSRNGTRVNGRPVHEQILAPGDRLGVGEHTLTFPFDPASTSAGRPAGVRLADEIGPMPIHTLHDLDQPRLAAEHLTQLTSLSRTLLDLPDPAQRCDALCGMLVGRTLRGASALVLRATTDSTDQPPQTLCAHRPARADERASPDTDGGDAPVAYVSRSVLRAVCERRTAVLATNSMIHAMHPAGGAGGAAAMALSIDPRALRAAVVACPLGASPGAGPGTLDVLYAVFPPECGTGEWLALVALAAEQYQQAEAAWEARARAEAQAALERELERARAIQLRLVPDEARLNGFRDAAALDIAIRFLPSRWVGGDYVDVLSMRDGRVLLALADVAGKGMPAALVASSVHSMIHMGAAAGLGLAELFASVNDHLRQTLADGEFVTMAAVALDPASGAAECLNMGHPPPLVVAGDGRAVRQLQHAEHAPLGIEPEPPRPALAQLDIGDMLLLYSDGLSEMIDDAGALWGIEGLSQALAELAAQEHRSAADLAGALQVQMNARLGSRSPDDDRTCLIARRSGAPRESHA